MPALHNAVRAVRQISQSILQPVFMVAHCATGINRIAIIGGGPSGIACAKYLLAEKSFQTVDVYEQRSNVGGIWNLSTTENSKRIPIPQTNPKYGAKSGLGSDDQDNQSLEFESPLYDYLETNIPKMLMAYSDTPFRKDLPLFPKHADVLNYLEDYAKPVEHTIQFRTQVVSVQPLCDPQPSTPSSETRWNLKIRNLTTGVLREAQYDAVVVANGHYTVPHVPPVPSLAEWHRKYPGIVIHSKAYRRPEDFQGKKVLVIGNSASGLDIAAQLASCAQQPVYLASRSASQLAPEGGGPTWRKDVAEVEQFLLDGSERSVRTKNGDVIEGLDAIIFATGYFYAFPFFSEAATTSTSNSSTTSPTGSTTSLDSTSLNDLTTTGLRTHDVYKHFIHIDYPTLAFPVLNLKVIPFPLAENQAAVLARLWSGRLDLPSREAMRDWQRTEEDRLLHANRLRPAPTTASGDTVQTDDNVSYQHDLRYEGGFHTLVYPEDAKQINSLYSWAASARSHESLENNGTGKLGTVWDAERVWLRGQFPNIKAAYAKYGEQRTKITSLEQLGEEWRTGFRRWNEETTDEDKKSLFERAGVQGY